MKIEDFLSPELVWIIILIAVAAIAAYGLYWFVGTLP